MRKPYFVTFAVSLSALLLGCSAAFAQLRFRLPVEPVTLDWNLASTSAETYIIMNLMEGLTEEGPDQIPRPALADRWEVSQDGKTYTFTLKKGIKWSDGAPLTAAHFRDSWLRLLAPQTKAAYASFLFDIENAESFHLGKIAEPRQVGIKVLDPHRLQVKLRRIVPYFLHLPSFWVTFPIRLDLIRKYGAKWTEAKNLVTLGPYRLKQWQREKQIFLGKNPAYSLLPAERLIEDVQILIEKNDQKAREWFESGQIDFLQDATTNDFLRAKSRIELNQVQASRFPYLATFYLGFNTQMGPLRKKQIRRALCSALDLSAISSALQGGQLPALGWIPPGMPGHHSTPAFSPLSLFEAKASLAAEGFPEGNAFPKLVLVMNRFDGSDQLADFVARSWRGKLGIEIEARTLSTREYLDAIQTEKAGVFVGHWGADYPDPANFFEVFTSESGTNRTQWKNQEYDSWVNAAQQILDLGERLKLYSKAEALLIEKEAVVCPLFFKHHNVLLGPKIATFSISPLNYLFIKEVTLK